MERTFSRTGTAFETDQAEAIMVMLWGMKNPCGSESAKVLIDADKNEVNAFVGKRYRLEASFTLVEESNG